MSAPIPRPGILQKLYWSWKSLKLPWRTQTLIGADLSGNTFWEFQDQLNANRLRRIVRYSAKAHYADIKISRESRPIPLNTPPQIAIISQLTLSMLHEVASTH